MFMKEGRFLAVLLITLCSLLACSAKPAKLKFDKTTIDMGVLYNNKAKVDIVIKFKNKGTEKLLLTDVRTSCGCLTVKYPHAHIAGGATDEITATLDTQFFQPGRFEKKIQVFSNSSKEPQVVTIRGEYRYAQ